MIKITAHKELSDEGHPGYEIDQIDGLLDDANTPDSYATQGKHWAERKDNMVRVHNEKGDCYAIRVGEWYHAETFKMIMSVVKKAGERLAALNKEIAARRAEQADWQGIYMLTVDTDGNWTEAKE